MEMPVCKETPFGRSIVWWVRGMMLSDRVDCQWNSLDGTRFLDEKETVLGNAKSVALYLLWLPLQRACLRDCWLVRASSPSC